MPELDDLTRRLTAAIPEQREISPVHGDFHLRNLITSHETGEVVATLDWELSTLGDPLADMGSLLTYWPEAGETARGDFAPSTLEGFPDRAEMAKPYLEETGRDPGALQYWHALGLWKLAIIAEGVMRRAMDEPQNKAAAGTPTVARSDALVDKACEIADAAGISTPDDGYRCAKTRSANISGCSRCMKCPPGTSSTMYSFSNIRAVPW